MNSHRSLIRGGAVQAMALGSLLIFGPPSVRAQGQTPAALVIYPRVEVRPLQAVDTELYLATTAASSATHVRCAYTSGVGHCSETGQPCATNLSCLPAGQACVPACTATEFSITLSPQQVVSWIAGVGLASVPSPANPNEPPSAGSIPAVPTDPFIGELRCLQTDGEGRPIALDNLLGTAVVVGPQFSAASYDAISLRSTGTNDGDAELCLGANSTGNCAAAEYAACPDSLSINHFFEGALIGASTVQNRLTLVPCTEFYAARPGKPSPDRVSVDVTLTVINEFEEQTVASVTVTCFADLALSDIAAFSAAAQGTLGGQTFVQSAQSDSGAGPGVVGVIEQTFTTGTSMSSSAHGLTSLGVAGRADPITLADF
jgi:hypothetical protein